ncbi:helix-turn-helix domain-containing protein [Paenarthrobacter ilicis]|uniref:AraC-like DNA-binding protein n=1 Tax=Paenarthrobacter ilicis TaxID=43665 RepID=A0ABX0TF42_9MICC|nr:helix-turn-helix domain-containing protein [Paenarthrobacter ilicis]MBM7793630.1 AraC-like DNA-binding protein [Paenarthrobacter ilicis]NII99810.1 AraC-like DNA-binding protein [Paenarthrobacter ilicis]
MSVAADTPPSTVVAVRADSFAEWSRAISTSFVPLVAKGPAHASFHGTMRSRVLGQISVVEVAAGPHTVLRTPELIAKSTGRFFKLSIQLAGSGRLVQDDREALLRPGDLSIYDTSRPYQLTFDDDFRTLVLMFPHVLLDLPAGAMGHVTALRIPGDEGLGQLISPFLVRLADNLEALSGANGLRLVHNALDLVTTLFNGELDHVVETGRDPHLLLLARIHDYIEANLGDPDLSPGSIAAAHYISTRHLHDLFQEIDTTVASSIRQRRLERCRRDLKDPVLLDRPVTAIAARWGFTDAAHFSRIFRAAFGNSPTGYRNTA